MDRFSIDLLVTTKELSSYNDHALMAQKLMSQTILTYGTLNPRSFIEIAVTLNIQNDKEHLQLEQTNQTDGKITVVNSQDAGRDDSFIP